MLYNAIIKTLLKEAKKQPENAWCDDFFDQALRTVHFLCSQYLLERNIQILLPFIEQLNKESKERAPAMFLTMYKTEKTDGPYAKRIKLMLEPMSKDERQQVCEEATQLLINDSTQPLSHFHLDKIREFFGA